MFNLVCAQHTVTEDLTLFKGQDTLRFPRPPIVGMSTFSPSTTDASDFLGLWQPIYNSDEGADR